MPPLRERTEDIPLLIDAFLGFFAEREHKPLPTMDDACRELLKGHPWRGNVRPFRRVMERALFVCRSSTIPPADLPQEFRSAGQSDSGWFRVRMGSSLEDVERELIIRTIEYA